ncbi:MAG: hypothetical protein ACLQVD_21865 [Capsulimonadaceae bacterium]
MTEDTPFDFVLLGRMIGGYELDGPYGPYFDIDLAVAKMARMGLVMTVHRIMEGLMFDKADLLDWIETELSSKSLNVPISTSEATDRSTNRTPMDFVSLGFEVGMLDDTKRPVKLVCNRLGEMGLDEPKQLVQLRTITDPDEVLEAVQDELIAMRLNTSFSSPENLRDVVRDVIALFPPGVWATIPLAAQADMKDAERFINDGEFAAAAIPLCRAVDITLRELFNQIDPASIGSKDSAGTIVHKLLELSNSKRKEYGYLTSALFYVRGFMVDHRNPNMHDRIPHDSWSIRRLFTQSVEAITRLSEARGGLYADDA